MSTNQSQLRRSAAAGDVGLTATNIFKWRMNLEAGLTRKKDRLKAQGLLLDKQRSTADKIRAEAETAKAETEALTRETGSMADTLAGLKRDLERVNFQQGRLVRSSSSLVGLGRKLETFQRGLAASEQEMVDQVAHLTQRHLAEIKAKEEALKKAERDFEEDFVKVHEAERKIQGKVLEDLHSAVKEQEKEKAEKTSRLSALASNKDLLRGKLEVAGRETEELEERKLRLAESEVQTDSLRKDVQTLGELETTEMGEIQSLKESHGLKENDLEKVTNDVELVKDEGADILRSLSLLKTSKEESLKEEKELLAKLSSLTLQAASLGLELERAETVRAETEDLASQLREAEMARTSTKERLDVLIKVDTLKSELDNETMKLSQEVHGLELTVEDSRAQVAEIKEQLKEGEQLVTGLETDINVLTAEKDERVKLVEGLKEKVKLEESSRHQHDTQVKEKEKEIQDVKQKVDGLKERITATEKSLMIWKTEMETAEADILKEEDTARKISDSNDHLRDDIEAKKRDMEDAERGAQDSRSTIDEKKSEGEQLKRDLKDASSQLKKLTKDVNLARKQLEKKEKDRQFRSSEASEVEANISSVASDIEHLTRETGERQEALAKLDETQASLDGLKGVLSSLMSDNKKMKKELANNKKNLTTAVKNRDKLQKQQSKTSVSNDSVKSELEVMAGQALRSREEIQKMEDERNSLEEELKTPEQESTDGEIEKTKETLEEMKVKEEEEFESNRREFEGILASREREFKAGFGNLKKDIEDREATIKAKSKQLAKLERTNESASKKLEADNRQLAQEVSEARAALRALEDLRRSQASHQPPVSSPAPARRFFKTPRPSPQYRSCISPSPKKKLSSGDRPSKSTSKSTPPCPR